MATIHLPSQLAALADGKTRFNVAAATVPEALAALDAEAPMVRSQIFKPNGELRQFVGLFVDDRQVDETIWDDVALRSDSALLIIMSVAGG